MNDEPKGMPLKQAHRVRDWINHLIKLQPSLANSRANVFTRLEAPSGGHYVEEYSVVVDVRIQIHNAIDYRVAEAWIKMFTEAVKQVHDTTKEGQQ